MSLTVIIVSYKSDTRIIRCLKSIDTRHQKLIIETSQDKDLQIKMEKKFKKIKVILTQNIGYGAAMNIGVKIANTKYVLMTTPDIILKKNTLSNLINTAKKLKDNFLFLSPVSKKYKKKSIEQVQNCKGFAIFAKKKTFEQMGGWDKNFFLFYEDHDLCLRANKMGKKIYIVPTARVKHYTGGFYKNENLGEIDICKNWHFMWSKFYYNKKHNGLVYAYFVTFPFFFRSLIKFLFYFLFNEKKFKIYFARFSGLLNAYMNKKSWYRPA